MNTDTDTPRTGARTLWSFTSADGEGEQQHLVACATCSRSFTVQPGRVAAQVADDDLACELCGLGAARPVERPAPLTPIGAEVLNPEIATADHLLLAELFTDRQVAELDTLARRYTASASFLHLVVDPGGVPRYRPSLYCAASYRSDEAAALRPLADAYDTFQARKGDPRRVYRG